MSKKIQYKLTVKSPGQKQMKMSQLKAISDIKNVSSQKTKKGDFVILFQTKLIQSKEVIDFITLNKNNFKIEEVKENN